MSVLLEDIGDVFQKKEILLLVFKKKIYLCTR